MKLNVIALAVAAAIAGVGFAQAESVTVHTGSNGVVIKEKSDPNVVVKKRVTVGSGSTDCTTRSTTHTNDVTDRTVTRTVKRCD